MSFCRHASRQALQQHGPATSDYLWISDGVLANVFAQFERRHRRHGSSVPGPLEARRRLAKRRNMDLASAGGTGAVDIALFGGRYVNRRKWEAQPQPAAIPVYSPTHLLPTTEASELDDVQYPPAAEDGDATATADIEGILKSEMEHVLSVSDIKHFVMRLHLDSYEQPQLSRMIFSWMLGGKKANGEKWNVVDYEHFLNHPLLNVRGANNYLSLVEHLASHSQYREADLRSHFDMLKGSLSLGLVSADEIEGIIRLIPNIRIGSKRLGQIPDQLALCYQSLWNGLQDCPVLRPRDVGAKTLRSWLDVLAASRPTREILSLAKDIDDVLRSTFPNISHYTPDFVIRRLIQTVERSVHRRACDDAARRSCLVYVKSVLDHFEPDPALEYMMSVTESLLFSLNYDSRRLELLALWSWVIRRLRKATAKVLSATNWTNFDLPSNIAEVSLPLEKNNIELSLDDRRYLRIWALIILGDKNLPYYRRNFFRRTEILDTILAHAQCSAPIQTANYMAGIITSSERLGNMGLPSATNVLSNLPEPGSEQWKGHAALPALVGKTFKNLNPDFACTLTATPNYGKYCLKNHLMNMMFERLAGAMDITDPRFMKEAIRHIESDHSMRWAFALLLSHHTPLKVALSRAWRRPIGRAQTNGPAPLPESPRTDTDTFAQSTTVPTPKSTKYPDPFKCLELLHVLALAFSCAPNLPPRAAYRLTHWCYRFVIDHGGPLEPLMVQALYHAAVTRYLDAGVRIPLPRFAFVIRKVREVEGSNVADALVQRHPYYDVGMLKV